MSFTAEPAIRADRVIKRYGAQFALNGLDLAVARGEVFGLLGPNGAGKTTTIQLLLGLQERDAGDLSVLGRDPNQEKRFIRGRTGYMMQRPSLDRLLTGRENLVLFAKLFNVRTDRTRELLAWVGLETAADKKVQHYSGGMERRLDLAVAMLPNPELVVLDEPTLGLDIAARRQVWDLVRELRSNGVTVFMATHYLDEADRICDRVAVVDKGRIKAVGPPAELKQSDQTLDDVVFELTR
jgi:ABC-2 type transport system ATP-binding protein